jgi:aryl-alcohol dehydrogenase-like predicted oxidoreductase
VCEQPPYSMLVRGIEADVLPVCESYGMGVIPWSPLAGGWLSGKYGIGKENTSQRAKGMFASRYDVNLPGNQRKLEIVTELAALADKAGITLVELAVAFVINHPGITSAIIGPRTMEQLETQLGVPDIKLSDEILDAIDALVAPGTNVVDGETGYTPPALAGAGLRRR